MIDKVKDDISQALSASRGIPPWLLLTVLLAAPGGSALLAGNVTSERMQVVVEQLQEQLKLEIAERKQFEAKCSAERIETERAMSEMRLAQREQQLVLSQVRATQERLLDKVGSYQDDMLRLVRGISAQIPEIHLPAPAATLP